MLCALAYLHEAGEGGPASGIHVDVIGLAHNLLIHLVRIDALGAVLALETAQEGVQKLLRVVVGELALVVAIHLHHANVCLGQGVALEAVFVATPNEM